MTARRNSSPERTWVRISRAIAFGIVLAVGFTPDVALGGQNPTPAVPGSSRPDGDSTADQDASTSQPATGGLSQQEELTDDWGGVRTRWKDKGVVLDSSLTQFYQGVADGGTQTGSEYNGTAQARFDVDFGKLAGWQYWSAEVKAEMRFGGPLLTGTGSINPVNTAAIIPANHGTAFSFTAVNLTRLFPVNDKNGDFIAVSFGRFNLVDLVDEELFAGSGIKRFFNLAQIGPLTVVRQVPLVTNAVNVAYIRAGEPFVTLSVMDPNDHSLNSGLSTLFADGATFSPGINFSTKYFGKSGKQTFGGAITTKPYTPFDPIRQILLPGPPVTPLEARSGSWSVNYVVRQYVVERGEKDGWGVFSQVSVADRATSPVTRFFDVGLGGNGLLSARSQDEFGIAYAYTDLSQDLKDDVNLLSLGRQRLRPEHQLEMFYNLHITPWLQLTGDLQIIRSDRPATGTAIVPGGRLRIVF